THCASVVSCDIYIFDARAPVSAIESRGQHAIAVGCDVTDPDDVRALVDAAVATYGRLDVLVNNAGAVGPDTYGRDTNVVDVDLALWDHIFDVNLRGVMLGCRFAI